MLNNMEPPAFAKFVALPVLLEQLRREFALEPLAIGSIGELVGIQHLIDELFLVVGELQIADADLAVEFFHDFRVPFAAATNAFT